jgi:hypothetical protein
VYQGYPTNYPEPPKKKSRKGLIFLIILLVLALVAAGVYFFLQWRDKNPTAAPAPTTKSAPVSGSSTGSPATKPSSVSTDPPTSTPPASATGSVTDGATRSGKIATAEQRDSYELDLGAATQFTLVDVKGDVDFTLVASGVSAGNGLPGPHQYGVAAPGKHTIEVAGTQGATGEYSFRLVTLKRHRTEAKIGDTITKRLDVPGRVEEIVVKGAGAFVNIDGGTPCEDINLGFGDVADPRVLTPHLVCWDSKAEVTDGQIAIVLWSEDGKTGDYSFTIKGDQ